MPLFQPTIIKQYVTSQAEAIHSAFERYVSYFLDPKIQENIRNSKEEQFQEGFLRELFVNVLGYKLFPESNYNLVTEQKNETGLQKADGAILVGDEVRVVIELKSTKTINLKQVEKQAFDYKAHHKNASYVIISNFERLRFYIDNAVNYEEWNLFTLTEEQFAVLWLCLAYDNIVFDLPRTLKQESISREEKITNDFFAHYSQFKEALFNDLVVHNYPRLDKLTLFIHAQKLLDRLIFLLFAEHWGLIPPNTVAKMINNWEYSKDEIDDDRPLYFYLKKHFSYLDKGHRNRKREIFGYNGGLFKQDDELDNLLVSDEVLRQRILNLCQYDYKSDVDVNILGHIFEHSLTEIEEKKYELSGGEGFSLPQENKRKQDGIFYTPNYVTAYIIEHTLGTLCTERKNELGISENDEWETESFIKHEPIFTVFDSIFSPALQKREDAIKRLETLKKKTKNPLVAKIDEYRTWLLSLTVCDPACGSGAFLNAALDFLIQEHRSLDELTAQILKCDAVYFEYEREILENNLYGVDINEESVEITQLALWLRTARRNRKLGSLDNNIKCGNSLISPSETAAGSVSDRSNPSLTVGVAVFEKMFDWHKEFPHVFKKGGFDVVIGNPPYVRFEHIPKVSKSLALLDYQTYEKRGDIHCVFVERGFQLLKPSGCLSYIMPNKWMQAGYGKVLRQYLLTKEIIKLIDFGDIQFFEGATTYPCIFVAKNSPVGKKFSAAVLSSVDFTEFAESIAKREKSFTTDQFNGAAWVISSQQDKLLYDRLRKGSKTLSEFVKGQAFYGIKTGFTEAFIVDEATKKKIVKSDPKSAELLKPVYRGRNINSWYSPVSSMYLICTFPSLHINIDNYPGIKKHLLTFGPKRLEQSGERGARKKTGYQWFETQDAIDYWEQFAEPKIMYQRFQVKPCFMYDEAGMFCNDSMWIIPAKNKALLAILNSKLGWWLITKFCTKIKNGYQLIWQYLGQIPIPSKLPPKLGKLADKMISLHTDLQTRRARFLRRLEGNFDGIRITETLELFDKLEFHQFTAELKKQKINVLFKQQDILEEYFTEYQTACRNIAKQIADTDCEIDQLVYKLYGLTKDEIEIVKK